jgi:uncharacterized protein YbaR (Trm112 family)
LKPWLLNILACPIDKHHPLEAYFYSWETPGDELEKISDDAGKPNPVFKKQYRHLVKQIADGTISFEALNEIRDRTGSLHTAELYMEVRKIIDRLDTESDRSEENLLASYPKGLDVLYRYLNLVEVEEGLIRCPECDRWYPIGSAVETIPELMPDDLREEERDMEFLKKWESKLPDEVKVGGKPFNL